MRIVSITSFFSFTSQHSLAEEIVDFVDSFDNQRSELAGLANIFQGDSCAIVVFDDLVSLLNPLVDWVPFWYRISQ